LLLLLELSLWVVHCLVCHTQASGHGLLLVVVCFHDGIIERGKGSHRQIAHMQYQV
jgi:hypothetical protein